MQLNNRLEEGNMLLRELLYGPAKSKKTWWIGKAAEANFNILLIDGDDGWHILNKIKPEFQKRIQVIDATDELNRPVFAKFATQMLKSGNFIWDEKKKVSAKLSPNENCIHIPLNMLGRNDIVVFDSWTALVRSLQLQYAKENMIDLSQAEEDESNKWGFYRWGGVIATWIVGQLTALNCHVVVIAHVDQYEKLSKDGKKVIYSKRQVKSTSGPHAMQLPSQFSEILYFYPKGSAFKIDASGSDTEDGGSRIVPPKIYNWDDLQFKDIIRMAGLECPDASNPYINYSLPAKNVVAKPQTKLVQPVAKPAVKIAPKVGLKIKLKH